MFVITYFLYFPILLKECYVKGILFLTQDFIYVDSQKYLLIHQTDIISTYNKIQIFCLKTTNVCYYTSIIIVKKNSFSFTNRILE